jgi:preprotein translocase subunit SecE
VSGVRVAPPVQNVKIMKKFFDRVRHYIRESYQELLQKVSWPTWNELQNSAIIVMIASLIVALIILVMDISFKNIVGAIYKIF